MKTMVTSPAADACVGDSLFGASSSESDSWETDQKSIRRCLNLVTMSRLAQREMFQSFKKKEFEYETQLTALHESLNDANIGHVKVFEMFKHLKDNIKGANVGHVKVFAMFKSLQKDRDALRALLEENGIEYETQPSQSLPALTSSETISSEDSIPTQLAAKGMFTPQNYRGIVRPKVCSSLQKYQRAKRETPQVAQLQQKLNDANAGHVKALAMFKSLANDRDAFRTRLRQEEAEHRKQTKALKDDLKDANVGHVKVFAKFRSLANERNALRVTLEGKDAQIKALLGPQGSAQAQLVAQVESLQGKLKDANAGHAKVFALFESLANDRDALRATIKEMQESGHDVAQPEAAALREKLKDANAGHAKVFTMFESLKNDRNALRATLKERESEHEAQIVALKENLKGADVGHVKVLALFESLTNERNALKAALKEKETE